MPEERASISPEVLLPPSPPLRAAGIVISEWPIRDAPSPNLQNVFARQTVSRDKPYRAATASCSSVWRCLRFNIHEAFARSFTSLGAGCAWRGNHRSPALSRQWYDRLSAISRSLCSFCCVSLCAKDNQAVRPLSGSLRYGYDLLLLSIRSYRLHGE